LVIPRTANLLAEYATAFCPPTSPASEEMLTIEPPPVRFIESMTDLIPRNTETWLMSMTLRYFSSVNSSIGASMETPALFTRMFTGPKASSAALMTSATERDP
jgi:hypothetical protein